MIVIIASEQDRTVKTLTSLYWKNHDVRLLRAKDLSLIGWRHYYFANNNKNSTAVIDGDIIDVREIDGILTRIPCIFESDLINISSVERPYIASEMTAFLLSWLDDLACPILNMPTPTCLSGPYWRHEQWVHAAAKSGMKVKQANRPRIDEYDTINENDTTTMTITLVGEDCIGDIDHTNISQTRRLARIAGVQLLSVHFSNPRNGESEFLKADIWPDITNKEIAESVLKYITNGN